MSKKKHIEEADIVVDLGGGRLAAQAYRKRIEQLKAELDKANEENVRLREKLGEGKKLLARCITRISFLEKRTHISTLEGDDARHAMEGE